MNARGNLGWYVYIGSANGLVPSGKKPLPELILTKLFVAIRYREVPMNLYMQDYLIFNKESNFYFMVEVLKLIMLWCPFGHFMMTSSNGNIFSVTGHLRGKFTGPRWRGALMVSFICAWINGLVNNRVAGDWRRHRTHCDVIVMFYQWLSQFLSI